MAAFLCRLFIASDIIPFEKKQEEESMGINAPWQHLEQGSFTQGEPVQRACWGTDSFATANHQQEAASV